MKLNKQKLKHLGFDHYEKQDSQCFKKAYPDFSLFIAEAPNGRILTSLKVGEKEIPFPEINGLEWVEEFDDENS